MNQSTRTKVFIYQLLNTTSFSLVFPVLDVSKMLHKMEIMSTQLFIYRSSNVKQAGLLMQIKLEFVTGTI